MYVLWLTHSDRPSLHVTRMMYRDDDRAAADAALRWLRLHRRTTPARKPFDQWVVLAPRGRLGLPEIIATGGPGDALEAMESEATYP